MKRLGAILMGLIGFCVQVWAQPYVSEIRDTIPKALIEDTLLVPAFDLLDEAPDNPKRQAFVVAVNRKAKESNQTLSDWVKKNYPYPYRLVSLSEIGRLKTQGYRYFLDMVLMPKQRNKAEKKAMEPAYERFSTANKMYTNRYTQFHYYFYLRDLSTDAAYFGGKPQGHVDAYPAMKAFFKSLAKSIK